MAQPLNITSTRPATLGVDPDEVLLCDLGNKGWHQEDLENALRLWRRPVVLIAGRNSLDRLPTNIPCSIVYLDLSWNRLALLEGFAALPSLRELDVSHNGVQSMLGLVSNVDLRVLRISYNCIRRIEGLHQMKRLTEADMSHNLLRTAVDVRALSLNSAIRRLRIEGNPFCATGVKHGSYEIAVQHLLPGISLLDGKPPPGLSHSLPPPPSVTRPLHRGVGSPSSRTISRGGRLAVGGSSDDLSIIRKWRDLTVVVAGGEKSHALHDQGGTPFSVVEKTWARTGGGGPSVGTGSYAEIFLESQNKKRRGGSVSPGAKAGSTAFVTTATSRDENHGTSNENHVAARRRDATRLVNNATTPINVHRREPAGPETGDQNIDGPGVGARGAHGAVYSAANSLASYRRLTREERVAARRLAWSQARYRDARGSGMAQRRRSISRRTYISSVRRNADARPSGVARLHGKRSDIDLSLTARGHSSSGRQADDGVLAETLRPAPSQVHAAGHRRFLVTEEGGGEGGGSSGMVPHSRSSSKFEQRRLLDFPPRLHDENINLGPKRHGNDTRKPGAQQSVRRWNSSGLGSRRSRGGVTAGSHGGGGDGSSRARNTSAASKGSRSRGIFHPLRTKLGQRSRRTPRPMAPHASRCTPRDDAKPWREGIRGAPDYERVTGHQAKGLPPWYVAREAADNHASLGRDESAGRGALPEAKELADRYYNYAPNIGYFGGVADNFGDGDDSCGGRGYYRSDRGLWDESPFASPLSTAAIVQRVVSARRSWASSTGAHGTPPPPPPPPPASRVCCTAATRTHLVNVDQERCAEGFARQSPGPTVSIAANNRRTKSGNGSADGSMRYHVDAHHVPDYVPGLEEDTRRVRWGANKSLCLQASLVVPRFSTETRGADDRESHGTTSLPARPEIAMCAPHDLSGLSDAGNAVGMKPPISSQRQQRGAETRRSRRPPPATQPLAPKRAPVPARAR